jgi:hypothetical protein
MKQYLPDFLRLYFTHCRYSIDNNEHIPFNELMNGFMSPFWVERQRFFEVEISADEDKENPCLSINLSFFFRNILLDIYKHAKLITYCNENISNNTI